MNLHFRACACALIAFVSTASGQELFELRASDAAPMDSFGSGVDVLGELVLVGAGSGSGNASESGAAYLYDAAKGAELRKLAASDGEFEDWFGSAVALTETHALIGASLDLARAGSAYVFDLQSGAELMKLSASDGQSLDEFGIAVDLAGNIAVIGAPVHENFDGAAYVFDISTGQELHKLETPSGGVEQYFGVSVTTDGTEVIVGGSGVFDAIGAAYVFDAASGAHLRTLTASDGEPQNDFGRSVARKGERIVVGAPGAGGGVTGPGAAYVFDSSGQQLHKLTPDANAVDFGIAVAVSEDRVLVGDWRDPTHGASAGAVYVFDLATGQRLSKFTASSAGANDRFGLYVALDGYRAVASAVGDQAGSGSVYELLVLAEPATYCTAKVNSCGSLPSIATSGASSATACVGFTVQATNTAGQKMGLLLYSDAGPANVPFQGGVLCIDPNELRRSVPVPDSSGNPGTCDGVLAIDMNAFAVGDLGGLPAASLTLPGSQIHAQFWGRDKTAAGSSLLSDALEFSVGP